jgi:hypothetical protein
MGCIHDKRNRGVATTTSPLLLSRPEKLIEMKINRFLAAGLLSLMSGISGHAMASPEADFWKWFEANYSGPRI